MVQTASRLLIYSLVSLLFLSLYSCEVQRVAYFQDVKDSTTAKKVLQTITPSAAIVRIDDVMNITIQTLDPSANTVLNQGNLQYQFRSCIRHGR